MAKVLLNAKMIQGLKPPQAGVDEYFDEKIKGLILRVYPSGQKTWSVRTRRGAAKKRVTIGDAQYVCLADARDAAIKAIAESLNLNADDIVQRREFVFDEVCQEYLERHAMVKKKSWREDERRIQKDLLPVFRGRLVREITRREIIEFLDTVKDEGHKIKVNRVHELIRKIFNFAVDREIIETSPCNRIPKMAVETSRSRVLDEEEIIKVKTAIEQMKSPIRELMKFYLMTGQRAVEIKFAERSHFNFEKGVWTIPAAISKNKKDHQLPITIEMNALLTECLKKSRESKWMFPSPRLYRRNGVFRDESIHNIQKAIQRLRAMSGVNFNGHDFRRTMATWLASQKVSRSVIGKLLNHTDKSITAVYDRYTYLPEKNEALQAWTFFLSRNETSIESI